MDTPVSWRKNLRRELGLVCGSEHSAVAHELWEIPVDDAVALLNGIVAREDVLRIVVAKWQVKGVILCEKQKNTPLTGCIEVVDGGPKVEWKPKGTVGRADVFVGVWKYSTIFMASFIAYSKWDAN